MCFCTVLLAHALHFFFFFNDTATTEIYPLPLHDALPISAQGAPRHINPLPEGIGPQQDRRAILAEPAQQLRSEEHTSELQSLAYLVCRLLLEKKKNKRSTATH